MKTIISRITLLLVVVLAITSCGDKKSEPQQKTDAPVVQNEELKTTDELAKSMMEKFNGVIELTEEQKAQINEIFKNQDPAVLNTDGNARKMMRQKIENEVFTPEQQKKWKEYIDSKKNEGSN